MRRSVPHTVEMEPTPLDNVGDDGCIEWVPEGVDVPTWLFGAFIVGVGSLVLLLVLLAALLSTPANSQPAPGTPGGPPVPTTYGPPPGSN